MNVLLDDLQRALTDLLQTGLATAGTDAVKRFEHLSRQCADIGLHTGASLYGRIGELLNQRAHSLEKTDIELTAAVCRAEHYITLCRERLTEEMIRVRWQEGGTL